MRTPVTCFHPHTRLDSFPRSKAPLSERVWAAAAQGISAVVCCSRRRGWCLRRARVMARPLGGQDACSGPRSRPAPARYATLIRPFLPSRALSARIWGGFAEGNGLTSPAAEGCRLLVVEPTGEWRRDEGAPRDRILAATGGLLRPRTPRPQQRRRRQRWASGCGRAAGNRPRRAPDSQRAGDTTPQLF